LTTAERTLIRCGHGQQVLEVRRALDATMHKRSRPLVEELTGRSVIAAMATHHLDPDLAVEIFMLDAAPDPRRPSPR
jgi:uncharacterized protein YbcI